MNCLPAIYSIVNIQFTNTTARKLELNLRNKEKKLVHSNRLLGISHTVEFKRFNLYCRTNPSERQ
jgi:hypothetical protein